MRKVFLILALCMSSSILFAEDIVLRHNRGLFGYKYVSTSHNAVGNYLSCLDPGTKSCKWSVSTLDEEYEGIINRVDSECSNGSDSGSFQDGDYFVRYTFDREDDRLEVRIYSLSEARQLGYV